MVVLRGNPKPIVVLCRDFASGVQYMLGRLGNDVIEYSNGDNRIVDRFGQTYIVLDSEEKLMGLEIKDFYIAPGFGLHPDAEHIVRRARERKR